MLHRGKPRRRIDGHVPSWVKPDGRRRRGIEARRPSRVSVPTHRAHVSKGACAVRVSPPSRGGAASGNRVHQSGSPSPAGSARGPGMGTSTAVIDARRSSTTGPTVRDLRKESRRGEIVRRKALPIDTCPLAFTREKAAAISVRRGVDSTPEIPRWGRIARRATERQTGRPLVRDSGRTRPNASRRSACHGGRRDRPGPEAHGVP